MGLGSGGGWWCLWLGVAVGGWAGWVLAVAQAELAAAKAEIERLKVHAPQRPWCCSADFADERRQGLGWLPVLRVLSVY